MIRTSVRALGFTGWFVGEVLLCAARVLRDVATPGSAATPRVVRLALRGDGGHGAVLGALITLTPGTLTLGVTADDALLVHSMYHRDTAEALADLRGMEARLLSVRTGARPGTPPEGTTP